MSMKITLSIALLFLAGSESADFCMKCDDSNPTSSCMYGGDYKVDRDDKCLPGKSFCFRMKYVVNSNGEQRVRRGCEGPNYCTEQRQREDIYVRRCVQCDKYYCNKGSLV